MKIKYLFILIYLLTYSLSFADYNYKEDLNKQINFYKLDIERLNYRIEEIKNLLKINNEKLILLNDSIIILSTYLEKSTSPLINDPKNKFLTDEARLIKAIDKTEKLKNDFFKKIVWLYKHGNDFNTQILFSSKSFNDFYVKLAYLNKISEMRKKDFDRLKKELLILEEKRRLSRFSRDEYLKYIREKKESQKSLIDQKANIENTINSLKSESEMISRQIERKNIYMDKIERELINFNISTIYKIEQAANYTGKAIWELKGKLILPVQSVNIFFDFGKSTNPETKTVTYNNGIDVSIAKGSEVKCVADGKVEIISYLPYFGNIIVISHDGNYRSVYAIIKDITVQINGQVKAGDIIAKTSENNNGQCFHFELWKDNSPLDPKQWVRRGVNIN
ncbi:MAG: peptidoglycan DD-metalloendopeptidase family protein [Ignavibacteriae bacterium]|nr:peptidoglycan DD-metalloendopeptidase family protein [Ignavibacteriota bacterium]